MHKTPLNISIPNNLDVIFTKMAKNLNLTFTDLIQTIICNQINKNGYTEKFVLIKKLQHIDSIVYRSMENKNKSPKQINFVISTWHDAEIRRISNLNATTVSKTLRMILIDFIIDKVGDDYFLKEINDQLKIAIDS